MVGCLLSQWDESLLTEENLLLIMNRALAFLGVLLLISGSIILVGAYYFPSEYSVYSGSHFFRAGSSDEWQLPETPFSMNEGDRLTAIFTIIDGGSVYILLKGTDWTPPQTGDAVTTNATLYYYAKTNDLYFCSVTARSYAYLGDSAFKDMNVTLTIGVTKNGPNMLFLIIGVIVLLSGVIVTSIAVLLKHRKGKKEKSLSSNALP